MFYVILEKKYIAVILTKRGLNTPILNSTLIMKEEKVCYLSLMSIYGMAGFVGYSTPCIPDHQLVIVSYTSKQRFMKQMPGNIFNHSSVTGEDGFSVDYLVLLEYLLFLKWFCDRCTNVTLMYIGFPIFVYCSFFIFKCFSL